MLRQYEFSNKWRLGKFILNTSKILAHPKMQNTLKQNRWHMISGESYQRTEMLDVRAKYCIIEVRPNLMSCQSYWTGMVVFWCISSYEVSCFLHYISWVRLLPSRIICTGILLSFNTIYHMGQANISSIMTLEYWPQIIEIANTNGSSYKLIWN